MAEKVTKIQIPNLGLDWVVFVAYPGFLNQLQLTGHELAAILQKKW